MKIQQTDLSIVLIGMPGAGKSTLGVQLAKRLARRFIDSDLLIQEAVQGSLQNYLQREGYLALRQVEEKVLLEGDFKHAVLATGGSAVYSEKAMRHLQNIGNIIYLHVSFSEMQKRIHDADTRGLAVAPGTSLRDLYEEREPLYTQWAAQKIECDHRTQDDILCELSALFSA